MIIASWRYWDKMDKKLKTKDLHWTLKILVAYGLINLLWDIIVLWAYSILYLAGKL